MASTDASRGPSIATLPSEIFIEITSYVSYYEFSSERHNPQRDLVSISLTCRRLRDLVAPQLFRRVRLHADIEAASAQVQGLCNSPYAQYIRRLIISSSSAMPRGITTAFRDEYEYNWYKPGSRVLFTMRDSDKTTFPELLLALFRAVADNITSLKVYIGDVVSVHRPQDYSRLYLRTVSYALRNITLEKLESLTFVHPQMEIGHMCFTREIQVLEEKPGYDIDKDPLPVLRRLDDTWQSSKLPDVFNKIKRLKVKLDSDMRNYETSIRMGDLMQTSFGGTQMSKLEAMSLLIAFPTHTVVPAIHGDEPPKWLKRLEIQGYFNIPSSDDIQFALEDLPALEYLHLRGMFIYLNFEFVSGQFSWVPFFELCAAKESLVDIQIECLSSYFGNLKQNFIQDEAFRKPVDGSQEQRVMPAWSEELRFWNPIISKSAEEQDAFWSLRRTIAARRQARGLKLTRWLKACGKIETQQFIRQALDEVE